MLIESLTLLTLAVPPGFLAERAAHGARLTKKGPSPQSYRNVPPPAGVRAVEYVSPVGKLRGWYAAPKGASASAKVPAVIYAHGGYAFGPGDFRDAKIFLDHGAALFVPTWRGENGNPGHHEYFFGELDDLIAAVRWLAAQPEVDVKRIHVFGHSAGGVLAGLLALVADVPVATTGSAGGLYDTRLFARKDNLPFDAKNATSARLRVLAPNVARLKRPHVAFVGNGDVLATAGALTALESKPTDALAVRIVVGDHFASLAPAIDLYARYIGLEVPGDAPPWTAGVDHDLEGNLMWAQRSDEPIPREEWAPEIVAGMGFFICAAQACSGDRSADCMEKTTVDVAACVGEIVPERVASEDEDRLGRELMMCAIGRVARRTQKPVTVECLKKAFSGEVDFDDGRVIREEPAEPRPTP